jgi:hypothetical protein
MKSDFHVGLKAGRATQHSRKVVLGVRKERLGVVVIERALVRPRLQA